MISSESFRNFESLARKVLDAVTGKLTLPETSRGVLKDLYNEEAEVRDALQLEGLLFALSKLDHFRSSKRRDSYTSSAIHKSKEAGEVQAILTLKEHEQRVFKCLENLSPQDSKKFKESVSMVSKEKLFTNRFKMSIDPRPSFTRFAQLCYPYFFDSSRHFKVKSNFLYELFESEQYLVELFMNISPGGFPIVIFRSLFQNLSDTYEESVIIYGDGSYLGAFLTIMSNYISSLGSDHHKNVVFSLCERFLRRLLDHLTAVHANCEQVELFSFLLWFEFTNRTLCYVVESLKLMGICIV
eukprot:jgi/Galph1/863/GphlegSOOS_G5658.1